MNTTDEPSGAAPAANADQPRLGSIRAHERVSGVYAVRNPQVGVTRSQKKYLKCMLADATGEVATRKWSFDPADLGPIADAGFVRVSGQTQDFNGQIQLVLDGVEPADIDEARMRELLPSTERDPDTMFDEVTAMLRTVEHPAMSALVTAYLEDVELMRRFRVAPAAVSNHHAWIGGLLEHTWTLLQLADRMLPLYPGLNRDLVLVGLFLHDLGKTTELTWERGFGYTTEGNLVGHLVSGAVWLQVKAAIAARSGHRLPTDALKVLQHIVVSHHSKLEYGSAKVPATPEAVFVATLDDLDARTTLTLRTADRAGLERAPAGATFTEPHWALGTRVFRPDPLADPVA